MNLGVTLCLAAPGFVKSCKQIQQEATTLLYSLATFDVTNHSGLFLLDRVFNRNICSLITSIRMSGILACSVMYKSYHGLMSPTTPAGFLPSLERVHVSEVYQDWKTIKDSAVLRKWFGHESLEIIFEGNAG